MSRNLHIPRTILAIAACEAAGGLGVLSVGNAIPTWYRTLRKPSYNPPDWIFAPVWTLLYALMGVALSTVSRGDSRGAPVRGAQILFGVQLSLNVLWSYIFFRRRSLFFALIEIVALWIAIVATVAAFARVSRTAALLLLPYLTWVTFAALLNFSIYRLNR